MSYDVSESRQDESEEAFTKFNHLPNTVFVFYLFIIYRRLDNRVGNSSDRNAPKSTEHFVLVRFFI